MSARRRVVVVGLALLALRAASLAQSPAPAPSASPRPVRPAPRKPSGPPDVYFLVDGDRITAHTLSKRKREFALRTPFGTLVVPRARVARVLWAGEREEWFQATPAPVPSATPTPAPPPPQVALVIAGQSFWQAWDRREAVDPTLRLQVRLDGVPLATYVDARLDPQDLPGATVNSFVFDALQVEGSAGVAPDVRPGRIELRLRLPADVASRARLAVAYQVNAGTRDEPVWQDAASGDVELPLEAGRVSSVELRQSAGRMEFSGPGRKRMKQVETFRLELQPAEPAPLP